MPREFLLYSPRLAEVSSQEPKARKRAVDVGSEPPGVLRTTAMPAIIQELSRSMKTTARSRRSQGLSPSPPPPSTSQASSSTQTDGTFDGLKFRDFVLPSEPSTDYRPMELEDARVRRRGRKGKNRGDIPVTVSATPRLAREASDHHSKPWWLDVASPTWEDMRAIGKVRVKGSSLLIVICN